MAQVFNKSWFKPGVVAHICNLDLHILRQENRKFKVSLELHSKTPSQKDKKRGKKKKM
jgi:hypothetical protein